ncbi:hypothetical protein EHS25_009686 [Saitozyma podzolica]|uniref:Uncharacterized protein n=1 Tax=Saitozyma podzolica TaxID=1890683 RepID=A0A427YJY5_9TREE|nr:hypothetical protein EHS25_009686 [Saitozyma podzolica]
MSSFGYAYPAAVPSPGPTTASTSFAPSFFSPTPTSARKRRAGSPSSPTSPISPNGVWSTSAHSSPDDGTPTTKRRRPNLASGFSSLSITPKPEERASSLPTYDESQASQAHDVDEDDASGRLRSHDVRVEVLSETPAKHRRAGSSRLGRSTLDDSTSSTPSDASDEGYDSDATFRLQPRLDGKPQQADTIEHPDLPSRAFVDGLGVEDVTDRRGRKRSQEVADEDFARVGKRRRSGAALDMDMDMDSLDNLQDEEIQEIPRDRTRRSRTTWHEPERDRIVITALSPTSSRSSSPETSPSRNLSQPAMADEVVRMWRQGMMPNVSEDESRFEDLDDDEDLEGGGGGTDGTHGAVDTSEAMDVDEGQWMWT